ncbi:hypothetical protein MRX96_048846 [Rhipicephalus microplus]
MGMPKLHECYELSLNCSQDPCNDFYRFLWYGLKHRQQLLSVVDVAEDAMYGRALNALAWSDNEGSSQQDSSVPPTLSVEKKVAGFVKSCVELARSSLYDLKYSWRSAICHGQSHPAGISLKFSLTSQLTHRVCGCRCEISDTATPGIAAGRLLLLLNEYFIRARRFSARDVVQVEKAGVLRSIVYLLGLKADTQEALTLSLRLRVAHELGWMASREIAYLTLELAGQASVCKSA